MNNPNQWEKFDEEAVRLINEEKWQDSIFSNKKAFVCSWLSAFAYHHVPDLELQEDRIKIVPSELLQNAVINRKRKPIDPSRIFPFMSKNRYDIHVTPSVVVIVLPFSNVVFIAIRGTSYLYDWLTNFNFAKHRMIVNGNYIEFHGGFYDAISDCFKFLNDNEALLNRINTPIYVTGHSLGGAMAAITHAVWNFGTGPITTHSCYTFGMPKYGDRNAVKKLKSPYHIYNNVDIVPTLPPAWLGFDKCPQQYKLDIDTPSKGEGFGTWCEQLISGEGIKNHNIELYLERLFEFKSGEALTPDAM